MAVFGDSLGYHRRFKTSGGISHHHRISFQYGGVVVTITAYDL
jgi:hypothetical protein